MVNESIPDLGNLGEQFLAASADVGPQGQPTVIELVRVNGEYRIREFDLSDPDAGWYGLNASYQAGHIANAWELLTGDTATSIRIAGGTL